MIVTHNYFWPTINGHVYYDKPLGSYWLVIFSTPFTGGLNEAATRLPSAIAGLLAVCLLICLVRRLYDARTGLLSGVILATSFSFVFFSRDASADIETIAGELAALLLFNYNEEVRGGGGGIWVVTLWLIMAATSLTKGLLGFALPLLMIGAYACLRDGWAQLFQELSRGSLADRIRRLIDRNRWFFNWYTVVGIAIGGFVYYLPFEISARMMGTQRASRWSIARTSCDFSIRSTIAAPSIYTSTSFRPDGAMVRAIARRLGRNAQLAARQCRAGAQ